MRLTTVILIASIMQVSANGFAQKVSLNKANASLKAIFKELRTQTGYGFIYNDKILSGAKPVSLNVKNTDLQEALKLVFKDQPLSYAIENKTVIIKPKETSFIESLKEKVVDYFALDSLMYKGKVFDERSKPLPGASIRLKGSNKFDVSTPEGNFAIYGPKKGGTLVVSFMGYTTKEITLSDANANEVIVVAMSPGQNQLGEVSIVSTGYQDLPKERATGSFEVITKEMLKHSNDPSLIKRLEGIVTSVDFRKDLTPTNSAVVTTEGNSPVANLTIRGKNTLEMGNGESNTSGQVLVVIDGIASPYGIEQVNPEDVEDITILKDAAAASIWGSRAANGVLVVRTKKGKYDRPISISFNTNLNITDKMDLFYKQYMSSSDFIDQEIYKFNIAKTNLPAVAKNNPRVLVSPVVQILDKWINKKTLTEAEATTRLNALRSNDIRRDYDRYLLRKAVNQNYSMAIDGGSKQLAYRLSANYNKSDNNTVRSGSDRINLSYNTSISPVKNLEINAHIAYVQMNTSSQSSNSGLSPDFKVGVKPYSRLADDFGHPISINEYRQDFLDLLKTTYGEKLFDMEKKPLEDLRNRSYRKIKSQALNVNLSTNYRLNSILSANLVYSPNWTLTDTEQLDDGNSYYMRNLINLFTNSTTFERVIPPGDLYTSQTSKSNTHTLRGQLNFNKVWNEKHDVTMLAGMDIGQSYRKYNPGLEYYGYNPENLTYLSGIDYKNQYNLLWVDALTGIGRRSVKRHANASLDYRNRTIGMFSNAAYTYDRRYTLTTSIRKDINSDFGGETNANGAPFYHVGAGWSVNNEGFYNVSWLPTLRVRTTFGYNGNVNPTARARPNLSITPLGSIYDNYLAYATTYAPSNSKLRPERSAVLMFGLDWGLKNNRISGTIEYYNSKVTDLIAQNSIDPTTGFISPSINNGNLRKEGIDLTVNSLNIQNDLFKWNSTFLFSYNKVRVTKLNLIHATNASTLVSSAYVYRVGYDLTNVFAYKWGGLDPTTGDPRGYVDGKLVSISNTSAGNQAASDIQNGDINSVRFFGSAVPVYFGSFGNTLSYGRLSVSAIMVYKLGYWVRRPYSDIIGYQRLYGSGELQGIEFEKRWQKPGDETITNVPSAIYPASSFRDNFYRYSEVNVVKGDHIRLQEITFSYMLKTNKTFVKNPRISANVSNVGLLWKANKIGLVPDIYDVPNPRTYSVGLSANF